MSLGVLAEAVTELESIDIESISDAALHESLIEIQREQTRLAAVLTARVSAWSARKAWADDGSKSAGARLSRDCRVSTKTANATVRRARRLRDMPSTRAAFAAGEVSVDHVDVLARCNTRAYRKLFERDEPELVGFARLRWTEFESAVSFWLSCAADEIGDDRPTRQRNQRRAYAARTLGGAVDVSAWLDPIGGEIFLNELRRLERKYFDEDWAGARARLGKSATVDDLARTAAQRRADALVEMARRSSAPGKRRPARPLITILWGADSFRSALCETEHGITLSPSQVIPLLSDADIERIVFGADSRVLDVGKRDRFFTGALRRAIQVRDRHCQHPSGCDVPAVDCDIDHKLPYEAGGETTQANGRAYCDPHNSTRNRRGPPRAPG